MASPQASSLTIPGQVRWAVGCARWWANWQSTSIGDKRDFSRPKRTRISIGSDTLLGVAQHGRWRFILRQILEGQWPGIWRPLMVKAPWGARYPNSMLRSASF